MTATGYFCLVTIYDVVFYSCPHVLPVKRRKSNSSLFSIYKPMNLVCLFRHNIFAYRVFSRPSFGTRKDSDFQPAFFSPLTLKQAFYHLLMLCAMEQIFYRSFTLQFEFFCYFFLCFLYSTCTATEQPEEVPLIFYIFWK